MPQPILEYLMAVAGRLRLCMVTLAFALACGQPQANTSTKQPAMDSPREQLTLAPEQTIKAWTGDFDAMVERRVIRVLTVNSKTQYFIDKGTQRGATYDAFRLFEDELNKNLVKQGRLKNKHLKVRIMFIPVARDNLLPALVAGKGDVAAANLTITQERQKQVDFTSPVYPDVSELVISGPDSPQVSSVNDLSGKTVFVRKSSSYYEHLLELNRRFATENKPAVTIETAPETLEDEDLLEMVNAGLIPLTVVDKHVADFWKQIFPNIRVIDAAAVHSGGNIAWAIRKNSPQFRTVLDDFLARHGKGDAARNMILRRYFKDMKFVKNAASESERKKFLDLVQFFQKYGDKYDVDWLLMAAQGYQESQLNQDAKSKVGAIGVMQVMPATGKELNVGDIHQVEPNIHAGIKYMRWMIDNYYGKEPMTPLDKVLFSFASYNAGAGRIAQLRKEAAKRGLNPNVWFHNVEYVVAEKIGSETVTYVSNIYKYYIAYRLILENRMKKQQAVEKLKEQSR